MMEWGSLRPLSNLTYFLRNKRKSLPILLIITLSVIGVCVISIVANSQLLNAQISMVHPYQHYARVFAPRGVLEPSLVQEIEAQDSVQQVIAYEPGYVRVPSLLGSSNVPVLGLSADDTAWFIDHADLRLVSGRLPTDGEHEIVLHLASMRSRDLSIGDVIGHEVDEQEFLAGRWTIVGVVDGPVQIALVPRAVLRAYSPLRDVPGEANYLVFAEPGRMEQVDAYLQTLPRDVARSTTFSTQEAWLNQEFDSAKLVIWLIDIITIGVLALATGLLNTIHFMQRMREYGTLAAIGYKIRYLVHRTLSEAMALTVAAWLLGLALAQGLAWLLRETLFTPRGIALASLDLQAIYFTLPIPILIAIFSLATVIRQLGRLDPVTIVERRD